MQLQVICKCNIPLRHYIFTISYFHFAKRFSFTFDDKFLQVAALKSNVLAMGTINVSEN